MLMTTSQLENFFSNLDTDLTPSFALRQLSRPEALSFSIWAYQTPDTLPERLRILDERGKKAHTIMESYAGEISLLTQSKETDMLEAPRQEEENFHGYQG